eukprot:15155318-Alexandrium_andersonii.AAC.1
MRGMAAALSATVGREACVVHANWLATTAALSQLGDRPAPCEPAHNDAWHAESAKPSACSA